VRIDQVSSQLTDFYYKASEMLGGLESLDMHVGIAKIEAKMDLAVKVFEFLPRKSDFSKAPNTDAASVSAEAEEPSKVKKHKAKKTDMT